MLLHNSSLRMRKVLYSSFATCFWVAVAIILLLNFAARSTNIAVPAKEEQKISAIIIGARKSGTRALLEFLDLHPRIQAVRHEVHFFDDDSNYNRGVQWYFDQIPHNLQPGQICLEKTPSYFVSEPAPRRIAQLDPHMRLVLIVREPVRRAISDYSQVAEVRAAKNKAMDAMETLAITDTDQINWSFKPLRNSLYARHLARWLHYFPLTQIHIVDGDAFAQSPMDELHRLESFLNLDHYDFTERVYFNASKGFHCYTTHYGTAHCLGEGKGREHRSVEPWFAARLRRAFAPQNLIFYQLANRTFNW